MVHPHAARKSRALVPVGLTGVVIGTAMVLLAPSVAHADDVVSQGTGRLITTSLLSSDVLDNLLALKGATAVNADASGDVTTDTPLDASAIAGLINLQAGSTALFGDNGIIKLGAVGQYAEANDDGSSAAFSGAVSQAPSLIGVGTGDVTGSNVGTPTADSTAEIALGDASTDPVSIDVTLGALAASAQESADGSQTGQYTLASAGVTVGGTILSPILSSLSTALSPVITLANTLGVNVTNPISADGTVQLTLQDLLDVANVTSVNDLPAGTNLLTYVPQALVNTITNAVDGVLDTVQTWVNSNPFTGLTLGTLLAAAQATIDTVLDGLNTALVTPISTALDALAQLDVNVQSTSDDGAFTETALRVGVGTNGSIASVDLASATVGPNAGIAATPIVNPASAGIAGGLGIIALGTALLIGVRRRRAAALASTTAVR